jgi:hypothetical protein
MERIEKKKSMTRKENYERYKTILNWMCVSFSIKKEFCQHIKKDYENDVLRC